MKTEIAPPAPRVGTNDLLGDFRTLIAEVETLKEKGSEIYDKLVQELVNKHRVHLATGHMSDMWQVRALYGKIWRDDMDEPVHPIFDDLKELDEIAEEIGVGPTNMMRYSPNAELCSASDASASAIGSHPNRKTK